MSTKDTLPNQKTTWESLRPGVEEFAQWHERTKDQYHGEHVDIMHYLLEQMSIEGDSLKGVTFNNPIVGLVNYMGEQNNRLSELILAYLSITVAGDIGPAKRLIAGHRLQIGLHPEYVAATHCYGDQQDTIDRMLWSVWSHDQIFPVPMADTPSNNDLAKNESPSCSGETLR